MEEIDDDAYQRREVFSRYGLALYHVQCVEKSLSILLSSVFNMDFLSSTPDVREKFFNQAFSMTLGQLINRLKQRITIHSEIQKDLLEALRKRNWLAHDYFYERSGELLTRSGRTRIIEEITELSNFFNNLDIQLMGIVEKWSDKVGITTEVIDEGVRKLVQKV